MLLDILAPAARVVRQLVPRPRRRRWVGAGKAHIEVRGLHRDGLARDVEVALRGLAGVEWAAANAALGRVVVAFDGDRVGVEELVAAVEDVEGRHGAGRDPAPSTERDHPGDRESLRRHQTALVADLACLGLGSAGAILRLGPVPVELAGAVSLIENQPRLRRAVEGRLGPTTDLALALVNASGQALSRGPLGLVVDSLNRVGLISEAAARNRAWDRLEETLAPSGRAGEGGGHTSPPRVRPLPPGPVERYADRAGLASVGILGLGLAVTRSPRRTAALVLAGIPKPARLAREALAAQLGRFLADRGVTVLDPTALRRLDRLDTLVVDAALLANGGMELGTLVPLDDEEPAELRRRAASLFDESDATGLRRRGRWVLGPLEDLEATLPRGARTHLRHLRPDASVVLGLAREDRVVALLGATPGLDPLAETLASVAAAARLELVVAGDRRIATRLGATRVAGGRGLAPAVRRLQEEDRGVALVARGPAGALRAADVALAPWTPGRRTPWAAHVIGGEDLGIACLVAGACGTARTVGHWAALASLGAWATGGALSLARPVPGAAGAAQVPVNLVSLGALGWGTWAGRTATRRRFARRDRTPWHALEPGEVLARLDSSTEGLSAGEAGRRRREAGLVERTGPPSLLRAVVDEVANPLTPLLALGAAVSAAAGSLVDAGLVGVVVAANAVFGGVQQVGTERALRRLLERSTRAVQVCRQGTWATSPPEDLVPGDVIALGWGDVVPADCRLLETTSLEVDESSLTGEALPVGKAVAPTPGAPVADRACILHAGTVVAAGRGVAVVVAIGGETEVGRALDQVAAPPPGGVEARVRAITTRTLPVSIAGGGGVVALGALRGRPLSGVLQSGVSLAVAAVPEGLPLLANAAQLAAARRLARRHVLVRHPRAMEALGRVDVLCFDKTGTLTEGQVVLQVVSDGSDDEGLTALSSEGRRVLAAALRATPAPDGDGRVSHATDRAVVEAGPRAGVGPGVDGAGWQVTAELPFEASRGFHAVLGRLGPGARVAVKGAPEVLLPRCEWWAQRPGHRLGRADRERLGAEVERLAHRGLRVLAVAERPVEAADHLEESAVLGLELQGFVGLADPARETAASAIDTLRQAGVEVVMATGDHPSTAAAIAAELGIGDGRQGLTADDLDGADGPALDAAVAGTPVFARVTPADKVAIVEALQRAGRVVAMTGDGANDAPAIRLADAGIAVGEASTAAARQAADVVVTDDHLETVVDALIEGRAMWASVRDALAILVGGNLGEIGFTVGATAVTGTSPLTPRQLLLVNLFTDLLPATAIALRPPPRATPERLLAEGPQASLGGTLTRDIAIRAVATAGGTGLAWGVARLTGPARRARTVALVALVATQLGQTVAVGGRSPLVLGSVGVSAAGLAALVQTPGISGRLGCVPLDPLAWGIAMGGAGVATCGSIVARRVLAAGPLDADRRGYPGSISSPGEGGGRGPTGKAHHHGAGKRQGSGRGHPAIAPDGARPGPGSPPPAAA